VTEFETYRPLLFSIAYRMLGSAMEAEDMVQEAYLRYQSVAPETIRSHKTLLCTIVTRLCLNQLESARVKREEYIGPWLPEPIVTDEVSPLENLSPLGQVSLQESISVAFLVLLESLTPLERAVFLLREAFEYDYDEIAQIMGKEEAACRQIFSRAKKHIVQNRPRFKATPEEHRQLLERFINAVGAGELDPLTQLLAHDVTMWADGGGKARGAAIRPLHGREAVAQFVLASLRLLTAPFRAEISEINGEPALIVRPQDEEKGAAVVVWINGHQGLIREIRVLGNPDKLKRL
jgi:RNA polymerase sigma-70 factor (ECF subfamily)